MKRLLTAFAITLLIAACSSSSGPEDTEPEYPKTIGTFVVQSPEKADWVGTSGGPVANMEKVDSDTIFITQPGDYDLDIRVDSNITRGFQIRLFTDIPRDSVVETYTKVSIPAVYNPPSSGGNHWGYRFTFRDDNNENNLTMEWSFKYHCQDTVSNYNMHFTTYRNVDTTKSSVFEFQTDGFTEVINEVVTCN